MDNSTGEFSARLHTINSVRRIGRVVEAYGTSLRVSGLKARIGQRCRISDRDSPNCLLADVVGLSGGDAILFPLGNLQGVAVDAEVAVIDEQTTVPVGSGMLGGIYDGMGNPLGDSTHAAETVAVPLDRDAPDPLCRIPINTVFTSGIRSIDALLTVGVGQRMGIFSTAGGGKSTLLSMLARHSNSDVIVIALIGERGREVREFIEHSLGEQGLARSIIVVATSDRPAMERVKAASTATAIAEGFRSQGRNVLLLMDSVTRYARALREIGLSIGEAPVRRGFPPSVFAELPRLFERTGNDDKGSITAFYTVLSEDEDSMDPVAEETRSILDGHIVLSRSLAEKGHYPAIDVLASKSRLSTHLTESSHDLAAIRMRQLLAKYQEIEFLIQVGEYQPGTDSDADDAIAKISAINTFLQQPVDSVSPWTETLNELTGIVQ
ncbi:MAG: FliI/YscN family ATPase [Granulosicoccus sp.]|nr:FliI/YscN family ATPase [Granulosicoccus sp.]